MEYTISELAKLAGVSTRTLRYYDEINLLKPSKINDSGYRIYSEKEVNLLQHILFYRELDVPLEKIALIINNPDFNYIIALEHHLENLKLKRRKLDMLVKTVEKTIAYMKGEEQMSDFEKFEAFKEKIVEDNEKNYGEEIRQKYGDEVVSKSYKKFQNMTKEEFNEMQQVEQEIFALLKEGLETNDYTSPLAKQLVELHQKWLSFTWPNYSKEAHRNLADMYIADERFAAYYDKVGKGATNFIREAIHYHL